ncbi:hypothetical protein LOTGIDRAFT_173414 [Lottia gigantea]|uniref:Uncharacterized protein n=1 Tax=Lottia gigantea TaxID=225164 RepID=V4A882_LOTGI|nr:hypothetical protein LOTGIDRAFT_173414 [Lottia gigantea]ESP00179.1 hypothetical protein LOTGIDRAFT_173414 [Lottia gigantea]
MGSKGQTIRLDSPRQLSSMRSVVAQETIQPSVATQNMKYGIRQLNSRGPNPSVKYLHIGRQKLKVRGRNGVQNDPLIRLRYNVPTLSTSIERVNHSSESSANSDSDVDENLLFGDAQENISETTDYQPVEMENGSC